MLLFPGQLHIFVDDIWFEGIGGHNILKNWIYSSSLPSRIRRSPQREASPSN